MKTGKRYVTVCMMLVVLFAVQYAEAGWTTLDKPGATETMAFDIDGSNLVGVYIDAARGEAVIEDG